MSNQTEPIIKIDMPLSALIVLRKAIAMAWERSNEFDNEQSQLCTIMWDVEKLVKENTSARWQWNDSIKNPEP